MANSLGRGWVLLSAAALLTLAFSPISQALVPNPQPPAPAEGWALLDPPSPRAGQNVVWDPVRGQLLMFGGEGGNRFGDLWSLRPSDHQWVEVRAAGESPSVGAGHAAVWDPDENRFIVHGGFGAASAGELWTFSPASNRWDHRQPVSRAPSAQGYHSAVWNPATATMLIFGGIGPSFGLIDDLWSYSPSANTWTRLNPETPPPSPVLLHAAVWDSETGQMLVFGGVDPLTGRPVDELWSYRPLTNSWSRIAPDSPRPPARLSAGAVWDPIGRQMLILGGSCGGGCYLDDVWSYRPAENRWMELPMIGLRPRPRAGQSAVWDAGENRVILFGGSAAADFFNDLWSYRPATYHWESLTPTPRSPTAFAPLTAWDAAHSQLIAYESARVKLRVYHLGEGTWSELQPVGAVPSPRQEPSIVWDDSAGRLLVFGGHWEGHFLNELWELQPDTASWRLLAPAGLPPPPRFRHTAVWDPDHRAMLVFGGAGPAGDLDDVWRYDAPTNRWERVPPAQGAPLPRSSHSAAWDPAHARMLVFGGLHGDLLRDLWSFDPRSGAWEHLSAHFDSLSLWERVARWRGAWLRASPGRFGHTSTWDSRAGALLVLGGVGGKSGDVWTYSLDARSWKQLSVPGRSSPGQMIGTATWDPAGRRLLAFTQKAIGTAPELWVFSLASNAWLQPVLAPAAPSGRTGHSLVWDEDRRELLVFGGSRGSSTLVDDLWGYQAATSSWKKIGAVGAAPSPRTEHLAAWDAANRRMFMFGGRGATGPMADLWSFDADTFRWDRITPTGPSPPPREEGAAVWDSRNHQLLVFGGVQNGRALDDLWVFDPGTATWTPTAAIGARPLGRYRHAAVWDERRQQMLVFGGYGGAFPGSYLDDLWAFDVSSREWTRLDGTNVAPPARARHAAAWDASNDRLLIFGGYAGGIDYLGDLWAFNLASHPEPAGEGSTASISGSWTQLSSTQPGPRAGHRAAWDREARRLIAFGGQSAGLSSELWLYQAP